MPVVTLLTDFGLTDSYVAELKAAVLAAAPTAQLVDVTHQVGAGNVAAARYLLDRTWRRFAPGTTHLVVVDPGVGTPRRALAAAAAGHAFVGPDNGVLSPALEQDASDVVELPVPPQAAPTFHGRDVFAPAAGRLAAGASLRSLGRPVRDPHLLPRLRPGRDGSSLIGRVVHTDRFGNLITDIPGSWLERGAEVRVGETPIGALRSTFGDVGPGGLIAYTGSGGTVEVAVRDGSAAAVLGVGVGADVRAGPATPASEPPPTPARP